MTFFAFYLETETDFSKYRHQKAVDYYMNEREEKMVRMRALAKELMEKYPNDEERLAQVLFLINEVYLDTRRAIKL